MKAERGQSSAGSNSGLQLIVNCKKLRTVRKGERGQSSTRSNFGLQLKNQLQEVEDCPHKVLAVIFITIIIINIRNNKQGKQEQVSGVTNVNKSRKSIIYIHAGYAV